MVASVVEVATPDVTVLGDHASDPASSNKSFWQVDRAVELVV